MAGQDGGVMSPLLLLRAWLVACWTAVTILLYGAICAAAGMISRNLAQYFGRAWMMAFLRIAGIRIAVSGRKNLVPGESYLFFSNHQSLVDIPVLFAATDLPLVFVAKKELFWIPIMGWGMSGMGHVSIDRSSPRKAVTSFATAVERVKRECLSIVIFPEGTRSVDGSLGEFKKGSFSLATQAKTKIVPVAMQGTSECLPKKKLLVRPGKIIVTIGKPIDIEGMNKATMAALVREEIETMLAAK